MEPPRRPTNYPSDVTDSQWLLLDPLIPPHGIGPRTPVYNRRDLLNAMLFRARTGCQWRSLPSDFPPWSSVKNHFYAWRDAKGFERVNDVLREKTRVAEGREPEPSLGVLDSQSAKTTSSVPSKTRGFDAGKKIKGRKRHIVVDVLGLVIAVAVTPADIQDRDAAPTVLAIARSKSHRLEKVLVDSAYNGPVIAKAERDLRLKIEQVLRSDDRPGFHPIPKRWVVERTFGWFNHARLFAKDHERTIASAESWFLLHSAAIMVQRWV